MTKDRHQNTVARKKGKPGRSGTGKTAAGAPPPKNLFIRFAAGAAHVAGMPATFLLAAGTVLLWLLSGPLFGFSDTWQLIINTGTTIVTFLMVFLIQNTQNRDSKAVQLKLDELIRATKGAHTILLDLEELSEADLARIRDHYEKIAADARLRMRQGKTDTGVPAVDLDVELNAR